MVIDPFYHSELPPPTDTITSQSSLVQILAPSITFSTPGFGSTGSTLGQILFS
jgi:hypothetical protein